MKTINALVLSVFVISGMNGSAFAEQAAGGQASAGNVKVLHCSMCNHTAPTNCPMCGMKMDEKTMSAGEAQAAIDKSKDQLRKRS